MSLALALLSSIGGALAQALAGFGFVVVAVPPMAALWGPQTGVAVALLLATPASALTAFWERSSISGRLVSPLLTGSLVGVPIGWLVLLTLPAQVLTLSFAVLALASVLVMSTTPRLRWVPGPWEALGAGVLAGVAGGSSGMSGPFIAIFLSGSDLSPTAARANLAAVVAVVNLAVVGGLLATQQVPLARALDSAAPLAPFVLLGWIIGTRVASGVSPNVIRAAMLSLVGVGALTALWSAIGT